MSAGFLRRARRLLGLSAETAADVMTSDVQVDHQAKKIRATVYLPRSGPCPHSIQVRPPSGEPFNSPCIGEKGHAMNRAPMPSHRDRDGRTW